MTRRVIGIAVVAALCAAATAASQDTKDTALIETVKAYRAAKHDGDADAVRAVLGKDARIWFGKKEGEGSPIKPEGGPWSAWDHFFNATGKAIGDYEVKDNTVSVLMEETNDYYRLLDRPAGRYRATYYFDDAGRIAGVLIDGSGQERDPGRYDEFVAWAKEKHPGLLDELMPDGHIDPALENAKRWKKALVEWRAATGLPPIE